MKERQQRIYEILNKHGNATVEQLKHAVFASDATIRRDLKKWSNKDFFCVCGAVRFLQIKLTATHLYLC